MKRANLVRNQVKLGKGSFSLVFSVIATLISFCDYRGFTLGQYIWGKSSPYGIISLVIWVAAIYIGGKHYNDKYARQGVRLSMAMLAIITIASIITFIISLF